MNLEAPPGVTSTTNEAPLYNPVASGNLPPVAPAEPAAALPAPPVAVELQPAPTPAAATSVTNADVATLALKDLIVPVQGVKPEQLRNSFDDGRSEGRVHQALDIMAPQNTPVLAAADGTVMKLFQSDKGGITLYQLDASGLYIYYYAHLSRYADGMAEGKALKRGEIIGYVGDTGNAGAGNFHLHFSINKMTATGKWSGGDPINPYPILAGKQGAPTISGK
jgi:murein DD-endopeptidase MepM/ murein hydrolase activator NlpD